MKRTMSVLLAATIGLVCLAQADSMDDAKERRKARREQVEQLVKAGEASEGADGYLSAKAALEGAKAELVKAENADRKIGYEAIAKANGKTADEVGKMAAAALKKGAAKK